MDKTLDAMAFLASCFSRPRKLWRPVVADGPFEHLVRLQGANGTSLPQTRPSGPGSRDQSRPSSSQTRRTTRASRIWCEPPRGTSAFRPSRCTVTMTSPSPRFSCSCRSKRQPCSANHFRNVALSIALFPCIKILIVEPLRISFTRNLVIMRIFSEASVDLRQTAMALLYGPAARCKPKMMNWRRLVLRFCIRPI